MVITNFLYAIIGRNSMTWSLFSSPAVRWLLNLGHSGDQFVRLDFRVQLSAASRARGLISQIWWIWCKFCLLCDFGVDLSFFVAWVMCPPLPF